MKMMEYPFVISGKRAERGVREGRPEELYVYELGRSDPVAGPWPNDLAGRLRATEWLIERELKSFGPGKAALFDECYERAGGGTSDRFQLLFVATAIRKGWPRARVLRYAAALPPRLRNAA